MSTLTVRDLNVVYDTVHAVQNASFTLPAGSITALVGPNGAGKTSLMKALVRPLERLGGEVELDGIPVDEDHLEQLSALSFMPDHPPLYENLSVYHNLVHAALAWRMADYPAQIQLRCEEVSLWNKRDTLCRELSRGMRQRLFLAKALLPRPKALILDEPAAALDPWERARLRDVLRAYVQEGHVVLISSHIVEELEGLCDHILVMESGLLVAQGALEAVLQNADETETVAMETLDDPAALAQFLSEQENVRQVRMDGTRVMATLRRDGLHALLRQLIEEGFRLISFAPERKKVERVLRERSRGEVS